MLKVPHFSSDQNKMAHKRSPTASTKQRIKKMSKAGFFVALKKVGGVMTFACPSAAYGQLLEKATNDL